MPPAPKLTPAQAKEAYRRHVIEDESLRHIASDVGVSHTAIAAAVKRHAVKLERDQATKSALAKENRRLRGKANPAAQPERARETKPSTQATPPPSSGVAVHRERHTGNASFTFHGQGKMRVGWGPQARSGEMDAYRRWLDTRKNLPASEAFRADDD